MNCPNCARKTLGLFIRSLTNAESAFTPRRFIPSTQQAWRSVSTTRTPRRAERAPAESVDASVVEDAENISALHVSTRSEPPAWAVQKAAIKEKLNGEAWNPRKKLSPDTMEGIRHLHQTQPNKFTTPILADHFKVSPEAIRRILKSKWRPTDEEYEERMRRWDKRGERIWSNLVEMGVKPPKKWRDMGVGRAQNGEKPRWKSRRRNLVDVRDSVRPGLEDYFPNEGIIPIVGGKESKKVSSVNIPLSQRL